MHYITKDLSTLLTLERGYGASNFKTKRCIQYIALRKAYHMTCLDKRLINKTLFY